ncbi:F0F1 ATP synthase subunit delta [Clostridium sp. SYSU_GA19001]|uniref:F0F1 ATP synthase subunit delta n=1 Tax=Clostridium caldaquaticum TaxID=2940653 RepID=UPI0020779489|nr:F0F1 ATP synthase subunit delta [Clostridium caldaquaticum]MCM8711650.1 F0F1 ATP synthase subunit delta [Clostridium caldaquaticum]
MNEFHEYLDRRYALALYEISEEKGKQEEYLSELNEIIKIIEDNNDFLKLIKLPDFNTSKKKEIFQNIFKGKIQNDVLSFLLILIEKNRLIELKGIVEEIKKIHLEKKRTIDAFVKTVVPLSSEERKSLLDKLQKKYNKNVILNEEIDKSIIGGVYVRVGNDIIDGTIKGKYEEIKKLTLKTE